MAEDRWMMVPTFGGLVRARAVGLATRSIAGGRTVGGAEPGRSRS